MMLCTSSSQGVSITVPSADYNRPVEYHQPAHYSGFAYQQGRAEEFLQDQAVHSSLNYVAAHHPTTSKSFWEPPPPLQQQHHHQQQQQQQQQQQAPVNQLKTAGSLKGSAETGSKQIGHSRAGGASLSMSAKKRKRVATMAQRRAANIRERRRMFNLNEAFDKLRRKVPTFAYEKRLSRIETLRLAITYIGFMDQVIHVDPKPKAKVNPAPFAAAADSAADQFNESW